MHEGSGANPMEHSREEEASSLNPVNGDSSSLLRPSFLSMVLVPQPKNHLQDLTPNPNSNDHASDRELPYQNPLEGMAFWI